MEPIVAMRFGLGHWSSISEQAIGGMHRTLPLWLIPAVGLDWGRRRLTRRHVAMSRQDMTHRIGTTASTALALQLSWTLGYGIVSGSRTALRLNRLTNQNMIALQVTCPHHKPVYAAAHVKPLGKGYYVDGVFAWPRKRGGGKAVVDRLLARADGEGRRLALTALSPRIAAQYRRVGFRNRLWIYYMSRDPKSSSGVPMPKVEDDQD